MGNTDKIEKIEKISESVDKIKSVDQEIEATARIAPAKEQFDALMGLDQQRKQMPIKADSTEKASLMDQIRDINTKVDSVSRGSPQQIIAQAQGVIQKIEEVKTKLAAPDVEIKGSVQTLLKNKLEHIDESLKVALNRAGVEYSPSSPSKSTLINPIERFIGFLTHGQNQLQKLAGEVETMHLNREEISPASMLAIQIKVGYIQQEVEFFANVLNKSLESIKTIMNVQI
jgi:hypothetical protein